MTSRASKLFLVPTAQAYPMYAEWISSRNGFVPRPPTFGIFVAHRDHGLIAGACAHASDGAFVFLEHFSVNPKLRVLWRAAAVRLLAEFRALAVTLGKFPVVCPDRKSLAKVCAENGFVFTGARVMAAPMVAP